MNVPSNEGQLIAASDLQIAQSAVTQAILDAGVGSPPLLGVQVDKLPGANPAGTPAPSGQAYCWVIMADDAETIAVNTVQAVLNSFPAQAKAPSKAATSKAKSKAKRAK